MYRCPKTGYRVQGFSAEDISEDHHIYEPVTCPACRQVHHVNPRTGAILGEEGEWAISSWRPRLFGAGPFPNRPAGFELFSGGFWETRTFAKREIADFGGWF